MKNTGATEFNYYFLTWADHKDQPFFSLNPKESDLADNQKILNSLIGTLVKYGNSGKIEPYLAERFEVSADKLNWSFKLRKGLVCEDGTLINASSYKKVLEQQLYNYSKKGSVLEFEQINGWDNFLKGQPLAGLKTIDEDTIVFSFSKKTTLLLELLRMPYFGFWCPGNFENENFKSEFNVISSGPYKIEKKSNGLKLELTIRDNWFSISPNSPKKIIFSTVTREAIKNVKKHSLVDLGINSPQEGDESIFTPIYGVPTLLTNVVLNPFNGFFADGDNRKKFAYDLLTNNFKPKSANRVRSHFFFNHQKNELELPKLEKQKFTSSNEKLTFAISTQLSDDDLVPLKSAIINSLQGIDVEFIKPDKSIKDWREKLLSNKYYNARITSVDAGGVFSNSSIKMMFCSNLGVRYPDPSGQICKMVGEHERNHNEIDADYVKKFNTILTEDAAVIPIYYGSIAWLISKDIDLESLPSSVIYFQFEKIKLK
jgi:ABC-type transport system substrate-binding protein